ncbi:microtubule-binding protein TANGLED isoform X1 [Primulina eburnea]|uniref:microtubule-binding protein TANGLED isoform X1 n=2 Tax=Primulina eburnea TaxID=1245227 RepID=UPI003C6C3994
MVARSPPKQQRRLAAALPPLSPSLLRETVKKVDKCMARLQELQYAVNGGKKVSSGENLSPRCKQQRTRMKNVNSRRSSPGKMLIDNTEEWRRMSLPAMLLGETIGEIMKASQFARNIVESVAIKDDPKTPITERRKYRLNADDSKIHERRKKEKQAVLRTIRSQSNIPLIQRARSRINFKVSPAEKRECDKENSRYIANRVSPRNAPWARKTVLFPNPLFLSMSPTSHHQKFCKTMSPVIGKRTSIPHKFSIKSPPAGSKFQVKIKGPPLSISPTRPVGLSKKLPTASKIGRSFSPSRIANKLISPLKGKKSVQRSSDVTKMMSGLKHRPVMSMSVRFSPRRI